AWSAWKGQLIAALVGRAAALLTGQPEPPPAELTEEQEQLVAQGQLALHLDDGELVTVVAPDREGLLALSAGVLALHRLDVLAGHRLDVRSAHISTLGHDVVDAFYVPRLTDGGVRDALVKDLLAVLP